MVDPSGFGLREQFQAFAKVIAHIGFSAGILLAGQGLRWLIGWTLTDIPSRELVDGVVNIVTLGSAGLTATGVALMSMWVFVDDTYTGLRVRARHNAAARSGGGLRQSDRVDERSTA